jgi:iron complex transport system substrate-binding protein
MRIASLLASGTELVCTLGAGDRLVGRSHECDYPEWVRRLPPLSRPTFAIDGTSQEIDHLVRERLASGQPLYEVDEGLLAELAPDVLITQTHCEVCAVSPAEIPHSTRPILSRRQVVALKGGSLEGILEDFLSVAEVIELAEEGRRLVSGLRSGLEAVGRQVAGRSTPSVVCLEWASPIFGMGNWGPELVEIAGGRALLGDAGRHSTSTSWDAVLAADPDVLVMAPCGFGLDRALQEMTILEAQPGWCELRAVRSGRVAVADGNRYFNRSGPSVFETAEILAEILHPEVVPPRHKGSAWRLLAERSAR